MLIVRRSELCTATILPLDRNDPPTPIEPVNLVHFSRSEIESVQVVGQEEVVPVQQGTVVTDRGRTREER